MGPVIHTNHQDRLPYVKKMDYCLAAVGVIFVHWSGWAPGWGRRKSLDRSGGSRHAHSERALLATPVCVWVCVYGCVRPGQELRTSLILAYAADRAPLFNISYQSGTRDKQYTHRKHKSSIPPPARLAASRIFITPGECAAETTRASALRAELRTRPAGRSPAPDPRALATAA